MKEGGGNIILSPVGATPNFWLNLIPETHLRNDLICACVCVCVLV